jgi:hypothetical protein
MNRRLSHAVAFRWRRKDPPPVRLDAYTAGGRACQRGARCVCRLRGRNRVQWMAGWRAAERDGYGS